MSLETEVAALTDAIAELTDQVNVRKAALDAAIADAVAARNVALIAAAKYGTPTTIAAMRAEVGMANGDIRYVTDAGLGGSYWIYSSALSKWYPANGEIVLYQRNGSLAVPLATISGSTGAKFTLPAPAVIPAKLLGANSSIFTDVRLRRRGANATAGLIVRVGVNDSGGDSQIGNSTLTAFNNGDVRITFDTRLSSDTAGTVSGVASSSGNFSSLADVTNYNAQAAMYAGVYIASSNIGDSFDLVSLAVRAQP